MTFTVADPSHRAPDTDLAGQARATLDAHVEDPAARREIGLMLGLIDVVDVDDPDSPIIETCPWATFGNVAVGGPSAVPVRRERVHA